MEEPSLTLRGKDSEAYIAGIYSCDIYQNGCNDDNLQQKVHRFAF